MMLNKIEVDVMQISDLANVAHAMVKNRMPGMVVHETMAYEAMVARGAAKGQYKIIIPVDWPRGTTTGIKKFTGLTLDALDADGFEIAIDSNMDYNSMLAEMANITEFIKSNVSELVEIRFVMDMINLNDDKIIEICRCLNNIRPPAMIRTSCDTKAQVTKANVNAHNKMIDLISAHTQIPIKLSANISSISDCAKCSRAKAFAVSTIQFDSILDEVNKQPPELQEILAT